VQYLTAPLLLLSEKRMSEQSSTAVSPLNACPKIILSERKYFGTGGWKSIPFGLA
jgi:hypothetical protein